MTDWKAKFDSVVKDTENSLQNVKVHGFLLQIWYVLKVLFCLSYGLSVVT